MRHNDRSFTVGVMGFVKCAVYNVIGIIGKRIISFRGVKVEKQRSKMARFCVLYVMPKRVINFLHHRSPQVVLKVSKRTFWFIISRCIFVILPEMTKIATMMHYLHITNSNTAVVALTLRS